MAVVDWEKANCYQQRAQPELFEERNPEGEDSAMFRLRVMAALRYCEGCPVRAACLRVAVEDGLGGVRGGKYLRTRETLMRRPAPPCGTRPAIKRHRAYGETCATCHVGLRDAKLLEGIA